LEVEIPADSNCRRRIINDNDFSLSDNESKRADHIPEPTGTVHDNGDTTAPPKVTLEEMVEQQQKIIDFLFLHNTTLLEPRRLLTSDSKNNFKMAQLKCYCGGARALETYLGSLQSNFQTHKYLFQDHTDEDQYALHHFGSRADHTDCDMQKTSMINPNTFGPRCAKDQFNIPPQHQRYHWGNTEDLQ
jgi:hypothetical protein